MPLQAKMEASCAIPCDQANQGGIASMGVGFTEVTLMEVRPDLQHHFTLRFYLQLIRPRTIRMLSHGDTYYSLRTAPGLLNRGRTPCALSKQPCLNLRNKLLSLALVSNTPPFVGGVRLNFCFARSHRFDHRHQTAGEGGVPGHHRGRNLAQRQRSSKPPLHQPLGGKPLFARHVDI